MATVLDEVTDDEISRDHVLRRVEDWSERIRELYTRIESWLPEGYSARRSQYVTMNERMMKAVDAPARDLPILEVKRGEDIVARIRPRALWIIGVNGRLDFYVGEQHFVIFDIAENFAPPSWVIAAFSDRGNRQPLDQHKFVTVLSE